MGCGQVQTAPRCGLVAVLEAPKCAGGDVGGHRLSTRGQYCGQNRLLPDRWHTPYGVYASPGQAEASVTGSHAEHAARHTELAELPDRDEPILPGAELSDESINTHGRQCGTRV